ncbi:AMP-binding protein [Cohnella sp. CFH 77786]|uniref:AMP-binding protein n=1 Tax=Cohnella sp. CFH 77786 TaxID=2662265 RepID=UPI001C60E0DD|nr:AMP-binding protein [Cohnella sp. CFH 77786]MBW5448279.1 AMP-binding protein [Cohnella sp. CFH 77786]
MPNKPWLKEYPAEVPPTFAYPKRNLAHFLTDSAASHPGHAALDFLGKRMTYRALLESARRFANALLRLGVRKGDRVAVMLPNCPQAVIAYYGTLMIGGTVVMTNPLYVPRELEHQLKDSGARIIVTLDQLLERVRKSTADSPMNHTIVTTIQDYLPFPKNILFALKQKKDGKAVKVAYGGNVHAFRELLARSAPDPVDDPVDADRDLALVQYTGGTTGLAKGVMLTHSNLVANTIQARLWCYKSRDGMERYMAALPFFHVFGLTCLLHLGIYTAGTLILLPRFEINQVLQTIRKKRPTVFPGAPTMYVAIINHPRIGRFDISSIRMCISGAAPLPLQVQERFEALTGGRLIEGYGLTEASPVTHANNVWEKRKIGSIGIPFPDTEARIVNPETFEDMPPGEIGELAVRGPQVMQGYWNRPEETARVLRDGWLLTGDLGKMDEEGFCYILDRRKDLIIAGGYNIYPREVEEVLFEHPDVEEAAVAGVVDPYRGETVKAYIVLRQGAAPNPDELKMWCKEKLAAYKVPKIFEFREALPKTMAGKVLRRKLIEEEEEKARTS